MVSRVIAAKLLKIKKYRAKKSGKQRRHTGIALNTGPAPLVIAEYKQRTGNTIFRDKRGNIVVSQTLEREKYLHAKFPGKKITDEQLRTLHLPDAEGWRRANPVPRGEVLNKIKNAEVETAVLQSLSDMLSDVDNINMRFKVKNTPWHTVDCFFNATKDVVFFFEVNQITGFASRSRPYGSIARARQVWDTGTVKWVSNIPLSSPP